jgi:hypothetical protein
VSTWTAHRFKRPLAEREQRAAFLIATAAIVVATLVLATGSAPHVSSARQDPAVPAPSKAPVLSGPAVTVARRFLDGYLGYLYGHAPARAVRDAVPALSGRLATRRLIVPPAMRRLRPRVLALGSAQAPPGLIGVSATVNDGELASYQLELILARAHGRLLVATVKAG